VVVDERDLVERFLQRISRVGVRGDCSEASRNDFKAFDLEESRGWPETIARLSG